MEDNNSREIYALGKELQPYIVSLLFYPTSDPEPGDYMDGGTAGFIDTGSRKLLVTAEHVVSGFKKFQEDYVDASLILAGGGHGHHPRIINEWKVIDKNDNVDVATIEIPSNFSINELPKRYYCPNSWPPARVQVGEYALIAGYPGEHRSASEKELELPITAIKLSISGVSEKYFTLADDVGHREVHKYRKGLSDLNHLGGMSGSPVFVKRNFNLHLAGVLFEGRGGAQGVMRGAHIDVIKDKGDIDMLRIPD